MAKTKNQPETNKSHCDFRDSCSILGQWQGILHAGGPVSIGIRLMRD